MTRPEALALIRATIEAHPDADPDQLARAIVDALTSAGLPIEPEPTPRIVRAKRPSRRY